MEDIVIEFVRESLEMRLKNKEGMVSGIDIVIDKAINLGS